jgi:hypothetical protein
MAISCLLCFRPGPGWWLHAGGALAPAPAPQRPSAPASMHGEAMRRSTD